VFAMPEACDWSAATQIAPHCIRSYFSDRDTRSRPLCEGDTTDICTTSADSCS
jgi:hypothetical protein